MPTSRCSSSPRRSTSCRRRRASTSTSTSTVPAARSWPPSARRTSLWDFRVPRVKSISTSGHKFGLAPLGVGWVLWRDAAELPDDLIFHVTYLGGDMPVFQINFSRPAGQVVAQYYNFVRLGRGRLPQRARRLLRDRQVPGRGDRQARARSSCCATRTRRRGSPRWPGASRRARTRATRSTTSPTGCGRGAGRCRPIR